MGHIEDLQARGFGSHGGKQHIHHGHIQPLGKRVLVCRMHFGENKTAGGIIICLLYTSPSPRDGLLSRMPSSA